MGIARLLFIAWIACLRALALIGLLAATSCTSDGDGPDRSEFVAYWADGDAWCAHVAECELAVKKECERNWPKAKEIDDALVLAQLSDDQLAKCNVAQHALDACFLKRSCDELNNAVGPACPAEKQRADLDCASLILAFGMTPIEMDDDDEDAITAGDEPASAADTRLAQMLCQHSSECTGEPTADAQDDCVAAIATTLSQIPSPQAVVSCVLGMSCETLQADDDAENACLMIDTNRTQCSDSQTLQLCNTAGTCVQTDCETFCTTRGLVLGGCGFSEEDGYDQCLCEL